MNDNFKCHKPSFCAIMITLCVIMLSGCGVKQEGKVVKDGYHLAPETDYQAYALAKSHEPKTFATFELSGAKFIKIKGDDLKLTLNDELTHNVSGIERPKKWWEKTLETVDKALPAALRGWIWYEGFQFGEKVVEGLSKDPLVVEQRHDTVTSHETVTTTETVEVVEQDVVVEVPTPFPQNIDNSTNTTNNFYTEPEVP